MKARVCRCGRRVYTCQVSSDGKMISCGAASGLFKDGGSIVVGDYVELGEASPEVWQIEKVFPRESEIFRLSLREGRKKITAANADVLVIVSAAGKPHFKRGIVDRFLVRARQWRIRPLVVFNKMDTFREEEPSFDIDFELERMNLAAAPCFEISALEGKAYGQRFLAKGIEDLARELDGSTPIFVGQSGVGKSSTIEAISGRKVSLRTGKLGKAGKGSHTTTWSELIDCGRFTPIDSPGIRSFSVEDISREELIEYWPDLKEAAAHCKFSNCDHSEENGKCAFNGPGRSEAFSSRVKSYRKILKEVSERSVWEKKPRYFSG